MCINSFKIKPVNKSASRQIFCQCGHCPDCQKKEREMWSFRLQAELLERSKQGWQVGFCTLTYNDSNLPYWSLTEDISDDWEYSVNSRFPCFSRQDVRNLILRLRKYLWKHYNVKGISYMVCSEFGKKGTKRPHYHAVFAWPPVIDAQKMHSIICDLWTDKGFVFPKDYLGGVDSEGYQHKPFLVESVNESAKYCAKYVCKDLGFFTEAEEAGVDIHDRFFRKECAPFHIQSRSLGFDFLANLSEDEQLKLLIDGFAFVGESYLHSCPVYFRNKILFNTSYIYDIHTHNRLVRREASDFFRLHKRAIYNKRKEVCSRFFEQLKSKDFLVNRVEQWYHDNFDDSASCYDNLSSCITDWIILALPMLDCSSESLAEYFLSYYRVPIEYRLSDPVESWFNRFTQFNYSEMDMDFLLRQVNYEKMIESALNLYRCINNPRLPQEELVKMVSDYHKSKEY